MTKTEKIEKQKDMTLVEGGRDEITLIDPHYQLMQMVLEKGGDISSLEKLMDLQERAQANQAKQGFFNAMSDFQASLPVIEKTGKASFPTKDQQGRVNGKMEYDFAKLEDIAKLIRPAIKSCGLSYRFEQSTASGRYRVVCIVSHREGHSEQTEMEAPADSSGKKNPIQQIASTISYLRRYTLTGALGIIVGGEDNDAVDNSDHGQEDNQPDKEIIGAISDEKFDSMFPAWENVLLTKKKTAEELIAYIEGKGTILDGCHKLAIKSVKVYKS
ncbi:MAG: ERF family protein [Thiomicrorhabdus sp.]|jgi:hypothetical protein|nr:ERF family protein [Thiomicrorhabdus sp.]